MKKTILLLTLSCLMLNCSPDDKKSTTPINSNTFAIELVPSSTDVVVDQAFTVTVNANENINNLSISLDNFATATNTTNNFGSSYTLYFNFDDLGQKTISIRAKNKDYVVSEKKVVININRGNAVKVTGVRVISFYGINTVYDPEFGSLNPEGLADLQFGFVKTLKGSYLNDSYSRSTWYQSPIIANQGNMTWDFADANLYINPNKTIYFGLVDIDGSIATNLLNGFPDYREIGFSDYLVTKPAYITYSYPEINLEFKVFVEWPN